MEFREVNTSNPVEPSSRLCCREKKPENVITKKRVYTYVPAVGRSSVLFYLLGFSRSGTVYIDTETLVRRARPWVV